MLGWLTRRRKTPGWLAVSLADGGVDYVHAQLVAGAPPRIAKYGAGARRDSLGAARYRCATLLAPGEYQMLQVEAPNVPAEELKSATRWQLKEMIDYPVSEATVDVVEIPPDDAQSARARMLFAVAARNDLIRERMERFDAAGMPLDAIDIPEMGQRNIAALHEEADRGVAMLYFGEDWGLLTINYRGELYLGRRLDAGLRQLGADDGDARAETLERIVLEFQRTLDHFERQHRNVPVTRLLIAPTPAETGLAAHMAANLGIPVDTVDLRQVLGFDAAAPDETTQWRLFHHFGAALRQEGRAQ